MKAKDYLMEIRKLDCMIENKIAEAQHWRDVAVGTTSHSDGDRVRSSGSKQKMADAVCKYVQMEDEINRDIDKLVETKQAVIRTIELLPAKEYDVLHKVYVQGKDFFQVAADLGMSYSGVTTIHSRAKKSLQRILDNREVNHD